MPKDFKSAIKDPRVVMRAIIGVLLAANLVAAILAIKPFGGSAEDQRREQAELRKQLSGMQQQLANTKRLVDKAEGARRDGDDFIGNYFTDRRTTFSTVIGELDRTAQEAGIKLRQDSLELNAIEGSDTLQMMSITVAYEGPYAGLTKFVNLLDKSPRFLIIESMQASPQQGGALLTVSLKLDTFVKDTPGATL
jgi:type IV pilus assembly protein PilO